MRPSTSTRKMSDIRASDQRGLRPLAGKRILVTRSITQAGALTEPLTELGAEPVVCPTIEIVPPASLSELEDALARLGQVDFLILSSVNAVEIFFSQLQAKGLGLENLQEKQIVAVGPKTAQAIETHGLHVDLVPTDFRAEGIIDLIRARVAGKLVLYPKAGLARDLIPAQLTAAGARVLDPVAYTSIAPAGASQKLDNAILEGLDLITFTASSTVRNFVKLLSPETLEMARKVPVASIGPLTSQTAREYGLQVAVEPKDSTLDAMVEAIEDYFEALSCKS